MNKRRMLGWGLAASIGLVSLAGLAQGEDGLSVLVLRGEEVVEVSLDGFPLLSGSVAYEGPSVGSGEANWKGEHTYDGVSLRAVIEAAGPLSPDETLAVIAGDGWHKTLPYDVVYGRSPAGTALLATRRDGQALADDGPMLVFLASDGRFGNDDMLAAFGPELAHYYGDRPSTTGMLVKGVSYLAVDYDGEAIATTPQPTTESGSGRSEGILLAVVRGDFDVEYTLADLEAMDRLAGEGTFTKSNGVEYTATYLGVPMMTLIGNVPGDATVRVTAADGYSMNYAVDVLSDHSDGTWILAYAANGAYMPFDPGPLRIVKVGPENPEFASALSARMVERIEVIGTYEEYSLLVTGAVERRFLRTELEAGIFCPCHTATVSATSRDEIHEYTGLPLWRLVAYADDERFPHPAEGIFYEEEHFNADLAAKDYEIVLVAADGYRQTVRSSWIAGDDRYIVAFKVDGAFL
ncbi:MAG: hypothetical protein JSW65_06945, partial [Candidatus Bipolaricaulota bacterium]